VVDFSKRLGQRQRPSIIDPCALYETLDRASDKGPLRPAQVAILEAWQKSRRSTRDTIIKLHTGQGKTLIGLLILQSKLNETRAPAVYLCPDNFLIKQTCLQAKQFGIRFCTAEPDLPADFIDGKQLLITSIQKLFNGLSRFGIGRSSTAVHSILMDDAHACIDAIRHSFEIRLTPEESAYGELRTLLSDSLKAQGMGTFQDIRNKNHDAFLLVPYWDWLEKQEDIARILSKSSGRDAVKFAWPLLKDRLAECQCVISGAALEIAPYLPPLDMFGSYYKSEHRVFMSATVTDDSFLVKGLGLSKSTIRNPLVYPDEKWSGEKMILIPSLIDEKLTRSEMVAQFAKPDSKRKSGVIALTPSFKGTLDWGKYGAAVLNKDTIYNQIENLRSGAFEKTLVVANRYDGIDLPDDMCRVLIIDSKPYSESLVDNYSEDCRSDSEINAMRVARSIEQGLGRSVRGEKDYCAIILIGTELIKAVRTKELRSYLSPQTREQVELGIEIAEMAREETSSGASAWDAFMRLVNQCLRRDPGWKTFYVDRMDTITVGRRVSSALDVFECELEAERQFENGDVDGAIAKLQTLIDEHVTNAAERGWYLQEMARYRFSQSKTESNELQVNAHRLNHFLLKPRSGMRMDKLIISQRRIANIISWVKQFETFEQLGVAVDDLLHSLSFGVRADKFEATFGLLGVAIGFTSQRPDREWKEGPDNLWGLRDNEYLIVECKSEVVLNRAEINKDETDQMNKSCAWFTKAYEGCSATNIIIIPTHKVSRAAAFRDYVRVMREAELTKLKNNVRAFFAEFHDLDFKNLSDASIQMRVNRHELSIDDLQTKYAKDVMNIQ